MRKILINFSSEGFRVAQKVQTHNFLKLHPEGKVYEYTEKDIAKFVSAYPLLEQPRGFGYWCWKYLLLREFLKTKGRGGDRILYLDSGCAPVKRLDKLFDLPGSINLFSARSPQYTWEQLTLKQWCKADTWNHFNVSAPLEDTNVLCGGYQMYHADEDALSFLNAICESALQPHLWDDSPSRIENQEGFIEHRHDQSVLTCYVHSDTRKQHHITITQFPNQENALAGEITREDICVILHRARDHRSNGLRGLIL